jgi:hypothetical protein
MTKKDWDDLLDHLATTIIQQAEQEVEGEFPSPQEILDRLLQFKYEISDANKLAMDVKMKLIDYTFYRLRDESNIPQ